MRMCLGRRGIRGVVLVMGLGIEWVADGGFQVLSELLMLVLDHTCLYCWIPTRFADTVYCLGRWEWVDSPLMYNEHTVCYGWSR